jgi:hypothetical protein
LYCGRQFSEADIASIVQFLRQEPTLRRSPLSRKLCELWDWTKPNGEFKEMSCRVALLRMQSDGLITLPPSRLTVQRRRAQFAPTAATDAQRAVLAPVHELGTLTLRVVADTAASRLWNEYVARYHYLGYAPMSGSQLRYNVFAGDRLVALLSFGASAWRLAARDQFIGWQEVQRKNNLQLVVNNARFLILPWVQSKGLASKILSKVARQLPQDWHQRYGYAPVLLETFVQCDRHRGTCYKAANWTHVGRTSGRGKKSTSHLPKLPLKDIWLYPLRKNFASVLCR